jgi:hypothetical protein
MIRISAVTLICLLLPSGAYAVLDSPLRVAVPDSVTVRYERGVELARLTEWAGRKIRLSSPVYLTTTARWKTEWQAPEGETDRIRQDGRWFAGLHRTLSKPLKIWGASSGEHFDDRPSGKNAPAAAAATSVHILRGGGGTVVNPWRPLSVDVGVGGVQDWRMERVEGGLGVWTRADIEDWDLAGYVQDLTLQYNRETPKNHENSDLIARYQNFREFFPGNANRAEASVSDLSRDISLNASGQVSRRVEKRYTVRDVLTYDVRKMVRVEMAGDLLTESVVQEQSGGGESSLKENQAGFTAGVTAGNDVTNASLELGLRSVNQTIRGEILQGHKADMSVRGRAPLPLQSSLRMRLGVSKYSLDTPNPRNYDDRDELRYAVESSWSKPFFDTFLYELHGVARLDHLVYLFRQSSANNRWTRFFLAGTTMRHRPNSWFAQTIRADVSANYQDYDYESDPRTTRSTVFRRLTLGDTLSFEMSRRVYLNTSGGYQIEEFGRLFWQSFEQERSDETRSINAVFEVGYRLTPKLRAGAGALWNRRRGTRFPDSVRKTTEVFQDLESYGPTLSVERAAPRGFYLSVHARFLRQLQLHREDRGLTLGEAVGGIRW